MAVRIALGSAAVGSFLGWFGNHYYESWKLHGNYERLSYAQDTSRIPGFTFFGTVSAATPLDNRAVVSQTPVQSSVGPKPISQIMKYGFPSLDSIRSFEDFVLSYDRRNRVAHWVFEHLTEENCKYNPDVKRSQCEFIPDKSIHEYFRATNADFFKSGFDRGHLAAAGNHKANQRFCNETFTLSNIAPQVGVGFNRDTWNRLEKYARKLTRHYKNVYVFTGPLYVPRKEADGKLYVRYQVIGAKQVAVPTHYFKIIVAETPNDELHMQSYMLPNEPIPDHEPLIKFLVSKDIIERAAGFLFFDKIPEKVQLKVINGSMLGR